MPRTLLCPVVCLALVACTSDAGSQSGDTGETDGPDETRFAPTFVQPADNVLELMTDRREDTFLSLKFIYLGLTSLELDSANLGPLTTLGEVGKLDPEQLQLAFHGGLVASRHTMRLLTPGTTRSLYSAPVSIQVSAASSPNAVLTVDELALTLADEIRVSGHNKRNLLATIASDPGESDATVELYFFDGTHFEDTPTMVMTMADYGAGQSPGFAASLLVAGEDPSAVVAWTAGPDLRRINAAALSAGNNPAGSAQTVAQADAVFTGVEWSAFGHLEFAQRTLVAEARAHADVEAPAPGDRKLVVVPLLDDGTPAEPPHAVVLDPSRDVDGLGPATSLAQMRLGLPPQTFAVRLGDREPRILEVDRKTGSVTLRPRAFQVFDASFDVPTAPLGAVLGALGSRTAFGSTESGLEVLLLDDSHDNGFTRPTLDVPPFVPSGPVAAGVLDGFVVLLVPFGQTANLHVIVSNGSSLQTQPDINLACDAVQAAALVGASHLPFVCLADGQVTRATLSFAAANP